MKFDCVQCGSHHRSGCRLAKSALGAVINHSRRGLPICCMQSAWRVLVDIDRDGTSKSFVDIRAVSMLQAVVKSVSIIN